jgi:hypothetical protein
VCVQGALRLATHVPLEHGSSCRAPPCLRWSSSACRAAMVAVYSAIEGYCSATKASRSARLNKAQSVGKPWDAI